MSELAHDRMSSESSSTGHERGTAPGKRTLTEGLRGRGAAAPAPTGGGSTDATSWTSAAAAWPDPFDFTFADADRGRRAGGAAPGEAIRGNDAPTPVADAGVASALGAHAGGAAPITITTSNQVGPIFGPRGASQWVIGFTTSGRTGWIVQKITNTLAATNADGTPMTMASIGLAPSYHEAWSVDAAGVVTPGPDHDYWSQPPFSDRTKGTWTTTGECHWLPGAGNPSGMSAGGVRNAGDLMSSVGAPAGIGPVLLDRFERVTWDATVVPNTNDGEAR